MSVPPGVAGQTGCMPEPEDAITAHSGKRLSNADLISRAAEALNPQMLAEGFWVADVGAAVEAEDGQVFTGACIGGYLAICAEMGALSQLVAATTPTITPGGRRVAQPCRRCLARHPAVRSSRRPTQSRAQKVSE